MLFQTEPWYEPLVLSIGAIVCNLVLAECLPYLETDVFSLGS